MLWSILQGTGGASLSQVARLYTCCSEHFDTAIMRILMVAVSPGDVTHIHITVQHVRHVLPSCCLLGLSGLALAANTTIIGCFACY